MSTAEVPEGPSHHHLSVVPIPKPQIPEKPRPFISPHSAAEFDRTNPGVGVASSGMLADSLNQIRDRDWRINEPDHLAADVTVTLAEDDASLAIENLLVTPRGIGNVSVRAWWSDQDELQAVRGTYQMMGFKTGDVYKIRYTARGGEMQKDVPLWVLQAVQKAKGK